MRRALLDVLACPACRSPVEVIDSHAETDVRILKGTLRCIACWRRYPIDGGVPRLVTEVAEDVADVCRRYSFQWLSRWNGKFECVRCYGFHDDVYIGWVKSQLECRRAAAPSDWMLDAGCGSGEKAAVLARLSPAQNVVGIDLGVEPLEKAAAKFGDMPNLDYVRGDILEPPFKERAFAYGMSLGVLHHTPDTRRAFASFRRLLTERTTCLLWIYPTYREAPEWRMPYLARDVLTLGRGYRVPTGVLRLLAHTIVITFYPWVDLFFTMSYRRIGRDLPFFAVDQMTRKERYQCQVFFCFDTLLPRYQWRHTVAEIERWFAEEGLDPILHAHSFHVASSEPPTRSLGRQAASSSGE